MFDDAREELRKVVSVKSDEAVSLWNKGASPEEREANLRRSEILKEEIETLEAAIVVLGR